MAELVLLVVVVLAVAYGLYAGRCYREAERQLHTVSKDWLRLAEKLEEAERQLLEAKAEAKAKAKAENGYGEYEALAKATRMVANTP
jgi:hypothetical protein